VEHCTIIGSHPVMRAIVAVVERLADSQRAVLITGEKGTGKGLIARYLHRCSTRSAAPLVRVDCAEVSYERLERELFGFDGLLSASAWHRAAGGVLLFDGLMALPAEMQHRLALRLRNPSDDWAGQGIVRVVATAEHEVASGGLTTELVRCLEPVEIALPALRQRRSDIPVLVDHFLVTYAERHERGCCRIETDALVHLWQYDWPGNVRELESVIERVVVLCRGGVIRTADLPGNIPARAGAKAPGAGDGRPPSLTGAAPALRSSL
jgi:DNA-binding NtrC family response regulator